MEWIELGELVNIRKGTKLVETDNKKGSIRMIMIGDLRNNENMKYTIPNDKNITVNINDLIIAWDGANAGLVGFGLEGALGSTLARLNLRCDTVHSNYLGLYLQYNSQEIRDNCTGATIPHVSRDHLIKIKIPVPSIEIQKQIVEVLDLAQNLIDNRKEQIDLLDDLIESIFYDMFGDPVTNSKNIHQVPLGELCNLKAGKFIKAAQISELNEDNMYPCYGGNGLRGYVTEYTHDGSYPLIGRQGALCGNVQFAEGKFYATEHAIVTRPTVELDVIWLYIMLREMNLNRLAAGAAQPGLNLSTLLPLEVIYPSINYQVEFANKFKEVEKQKELMKESLKLMKDNYNSLMQRAFKGELF